MLIKNAPFSFWLGTKSVFESVLGRIGIAGLSPHGTLSEFYSMKRLRYRPGVILNSIFMPAVFLIPVSVFGAGDLSFEGNLIGWFDRTFPQEGSARSVRWIGNPDHLFPAHPGLTILGAFAGNSENVQPFSNQKTEAAFSYQFDLRCSCIGMESSISRFSSDYGRVSLYSWLSGMSFLFLGLF